MTVSTTLRSSVYQTLRDGILNGRFKPGEALSEAELARALGVSRTPVREAIQALSSDGLVEVLPKRATLVSRLSPGEVRESFELREAIESASARLAAGRRTDDDLTAMRSVLGGEPTYERGAAFHELVVQAARSRYLLQVFKDQAARIQLASRLAAVASVSTHDESSTHEAVLAAIEARDGARAEAGMRQHLREHAAHLMADLL